jgi:cytochrome c553
MKLGGIFILSMFLFSCAYATDASQLYRKCAGCHGRDAKHAPYERQAGILHGRSQEELEIIITMIKNGEYKDDRINMIMRKAISKLSKDDIRLLSEYISSL